jgi:predicted metal-binding protein
MTWKILTAIRLRIGVQVRLYCRFNAATAMIHAFSATAITQSSNIEYSVAISQSSPKKLFTFVDAPKFTELCKSGCVNYNKKWACPPHAPSFYEYANKWSLVYLFLFRVDTTQFSYIKNDYLKIKAANSIMKSRADKYLRCMASLYGIYISNGSCKLCRTCKLKSGEVCLHPDIMSYSFEALGLNVGSMVNEYFDTELLWYTPKNTPKYTSVVCGLLTNEIIEYNYLAEQYLRIVPD